MKNKRIIETALVVAGCALAILAVNYYKNSKGVVPDKYINPSMDYFTEKEALVQRELVYNSDGHLIEKIETEYDENNRLSHRVVYECDLDSNELYEYYTYNFSYDNNYQYQERIYDGNDDYKSIEIYDTRGKLVYYGDGSKEDIEKNLVKYEYKIAGNKVIITKCDLDDSKNNKKIIYKYDKNGNMVFEKDSMNSSTPYRRSAHYVYDDNGRIVRMIEKGNGSATEIENIYDGELLKKRYISDYRGWEKDFNSITCLEYLYDNEGRLVRLKETRDRDVDEKNLVHVFIYQYDLSDEILTHIDI